MKQKYLPESWPLLWLCTVFLFLETWSWAFHASASFWFTKVWNKDEIFYTFHDGLSLQTLFSFSTLISGLKDSFYSFTWERTYHILNKKVLPSDSMRRTACSVASPGGGGLPRPVWERGKGWVSFPIRQGRGIPYPVRWGFGRVWKGGTRSIQGAGWGRVYPSSRQGWYLLSWLCGTLLPPPPTVDRQIPVKT